MRRGVLIAAALAALIAAPVAQPARGDALIEVVVTMDGPPLAYAISKSRVLTGRVKAQRLNVRAPTSLGYLASLATTQRALTARITTSIPDSRITWRYGVVLNGLAVVVPRSQLGRLGSMPGVDRVWPNVTYRPLLDRSPGLIGPGDGFCQPRIVRIRKDQRNGHLVDLHHHPRGWHDILFIPI